MLGRPWGELCSVVMNVGKLLSRFVCDRRIDEELSTMNSRSTLRLIDCWKVLPKVLSGARFGFSRVRALHAHSTGATAARAAQRTRRNIVRPVTDIGILLGAGAGDSGARRARRARQSCAIIGTATVD